MSQRVVLGCGVSSYFGWGIHGLNLVLNWTGDPDLEVVGAAAIDPQHIVTDALRWQALQPFLARSARFQGELAPHANTTAAVKVPVLAAFGNGFDGGTVAHNVTLRGKPTIAAIVFEEPLDAAALERARSFPLIVTASTWNERMLRSCGLSAVRTVFEGIDPTLFHPAPKLGLYPDRFLVFSGGKAEFRKGQDLVLAAFKIFAERHPEAMLVAAWSSPWPQLARTLDRSGLVAPVVFDREGKLDARAWAAASGVAAERVIALGPMANMYLPSMLREMDVALFPNRAEGGTNLVAMECMACGVPVILSRNTGHLDLIEEENCFALDDQRTLPASAAATGAGDWGESQVDEIVARLEEVFAGRAEAKRRSVRAGETMARFTWARHARQMKEIIFALR